jgi:hypothetical protein
MRANAHLRICSWGVRRLRTGEDQSVVAVQKSRDVVSEDSFDAVREFLLLDDNSA